MPKVTFLPANETFEYETGKLPYKGHGRPESLLDVAMNFGFHLEHACGGSCACTTCHVVAKAGATLTEAMVRKLTLLSLFWHFLDIVWIFIFTIVYLMAFV